MSEAHVSTRVALNAASAAFGLGDSDVDPNARAVPAIVSVGALPANQNIKAWLVTFDKDTYSQGPIGPGRPQMVSHKLCVVVDATTGQYAVAFNAGLENVVQGIVPSGSLR